jgi:hypothetical protein
MSTQSSVTVSPNNVGGGNLHCRERIPDQLWYLRILL